MRTVPLSFERALHSNFLLVTTIQNKSTSEVPMKLMNVNFMDLNTDFSEISGSIITSLQPRALVTHYIQEAIK